VDAFRNKTSLNALRFSVKSSPALLSGSWGRGKREAICWIENSTQLFFPVATLCGSAEKEVYFGSEKNKARFCSRKTQR